MRVEYALVTGAAPPPERADPANPGDYPGRRISRRFAWWATNLFN